jgi:DNA-binding transcriptional MerR regulator
MERNRNLSHVLPKPVSAWLPTPGLIRSCIGLLAAPARTTGNYRAYGPKHLNRLSFIRRSRDLGFSLHQIRAPLDLSDDGGRSFEAVDAIAKEHLAEVDRKIADLRALRRELSNMIDQCRCGTVAECRIIEAQSP